MIRLKFKYQLVAATLVAVTYWTQSGIADDAPAGRAEQRNDGTAPASATSSNQESQSAAIQGNRLGTTIKADKLIGMEVRNNQREDIGDVNNLIVDLTNGRVIAAIVSSGGFLGIGDTLNAVPPQAFRLNAARNALLLDVNKETLSGYPQFKMNEWPNFDDPVYVSRVYRAYRIEPFFTTTGAVGTVQTTASVTVPLGVGLRANQILGMEVRNNQREDIGEVDNLAIDLAHGRVVAVVVSSGGFLGIGDTLSAVPPQALRLNAERDALLLDVNKETLAGYPRLNKEAWTQLDDPNYVARIYQAYNVPAYWQTSEAAGASGGAGVTSTVRGTNLSDAQIAERVRKAISNQADLSAEARNVMVTVENGEIKLKGTVNSEAEKNRVLELARRAALGADLDDELEVK